jgi:hypothetical protein
MIPDDIPALERDDPRIELAIAEGEMENYEVKEATGILKLHLHISLASCFTKSKKQNSLYLSTSRSGSKASHMMKTSGHLRVSAALCLVPTGLVPSRYKGQVGCGSSGWNSIPVILPFASLCRTHLSRLIY